MSVTSEFHRYLQDLIDLLEQSSGAADLQIAKHLHEARLLHDSDLCALARDTLDQLERAGGTLAFETPEEHGSKNIHLARENLISIGRIVLGE